MIAYPVNRLKILPHRGGLHHGRFVVELRLQGCPIVCDDCSVPEALTCSPHHHAESLEDAIAHKQMWTELTAREISDAIADLKEETEAGVRWVKITGGEPCMYDLTELLFELRARGWRTMIETSGALQKNLALRFDYVVVNVLTKEAGITTEEWLMSSHELRIVVRSHRDFIIFDEYRVKTPSDGWPEIVLVPQKVRSKTKAHALRQLCEAEARWRDWRVL